MNFIGTWAHGGAVARTLRHGTTVQFTSENIASDIGGGDGTFGTGDAIS